MLTQRDRERLLHIAGFMTKLFPGSVFVTERTLSMPSRMKYRVIEKSQESKTNTHMIYVSKDRRQWTVETEP